MTNDEKRKRTRQRVEIGNRVLRPITPSRRQPAAHYLVAHACFTCRKSFKLRALDEGTHTCPDCAGVLHEMGRSFKAPARDNVEQWDKVQTLYAHGFRFFGNGSSESERLPARLCEVEGFLARNPRHRLRIAVLDRNLLPR